MTKKPSTELYLKEDESDNERYDREPKPISSWGNMREIIGPDMRYNQIEESRPEEMCEIEIHRGSIGEIEKSAKKCVRIGQKVVVVGYIYPIERLAELLFLIEQLSLSASYWLLGKGVFMFFLFGIIGLLIAILWKPFPNWLTVAIAVFAFLAQVVVTGPVPAAEYSIGSYIAHIVLGVWVGSIVRLVFPKK